VKAKIGLGAAALVFLLAGCGESSDGNLSAAANQSAPTLQQVPAPNGGSWTDVVSETADGGFLMGNPNAPVKLIEYASMTSRRPSR